MEEAERLIAAINEGADVAIGSRWMDRTRQTIISPLPPVFRRCFNWITRTVMAFPSRTLMRLQGVQAIGRSGHLPPADH